MQAFNNQVLKSVSRNKGLELAFWQITTSCLLTCDYAKKRNKQISSSHKKVAGDTIWKYVLIFTPEEYRDKNLNLEH